MAMLSAAEFMTRFKRDQEMLARGECPEGYALCPACERPIQTNHFVEGKCGGCHTMHLYDAIEEFPIISPGIRRRGL